MMITGNYSKAQIFADPVGHGCSQPGRQGTCVEHLPILRTSAWRAAAAGSTFIDQPPNLVHFQSHRNHHGVQP